MTKLEAIWTISCLYFIFVHSVYKRLCLISFKVDHLVYVIDDVCLPSFQFYPETFQDIFYRDGLLHNHNTECHPVIVLKSQLIVRR